MEKGILDINGEKAACNCGGDVERAVRRVLAHDPGGEDCWVLAYQFKCAACGAFGYQGLISFMEEFLIKG